MSDEAPSRWARAWPHFRAGLIALHVLAITLVALPAPDGAMNHAAWSDPTVQDELSAWTTRVDHLGLQLTRPQLEDRLWRFATRYMAIRRKVLRPFVPYYQVAGTWQAWRMFVAPHRYPARLHIDVLRPGGWQTLYVRGDPVHTWHRRQLDHDRMRAQVFRLSWPGYGGAYKRFADWLARDAARQYPDATRLRVRFFKYETSSPQQVRAGAPPHGRYILERMLDLSRYR